MADLGTKALKKNKCTNVPLVVDLDGTLIYEDTTILLLKAIVARQPLKIMGLFWHIFFGRAAFKTHLAGLVAIDVKLTTLNHDLIRWLSDENKLGRDVILCSGAPELVVKDFYSTLRIFSGWHSTTALLNLTGENKARYLVSLYGFRGFDYVGNSSDDLFVWRNARYGVLVNAEDKVRNRAKEIVSVIREYF